MSDQAVPLRTPLRFVIRAADLGKASFCCPVCGDDNVHPARVVVDQGRTRTEMTGDKTVVVGSDRGTQARGSLITARMWCEQGHAFEYRFSFHKGRTQCELEAWKLAAEQPRDELWRD